MGVSRPDESMNQKNNVSFLYAPGGGGFPLQPPPDVIMNSTPFLHLHARLAPLLGPSEDLALCATLQHLKLLIGGHLKRI